MVRRRFNQHKQSKKRDWGKYDDKLVGRGEMLIPIHESKSWQNEVTIMNESKEGARFKYADNMIECLLFIKCAFKSPFRIVEGIAKRLFSIAGINEVPDYSTLCRRMKPLGKKYYKERKKVENEREIYAAFDGTGLKVFNRGEWKHVKHKGKRKGFVRVCFLFDIKTGELLDFSATTENVGEQDKIRPMLKRAKKNRNIRKLAVDGAGDDYRNFELLKTLKIKPAIKLRVNANPYMFPNRKQRNREIKKYKKWGYDGWVRRRNYGQRWQAETAIACFKNYFGEYVFSKGMSNIKAEIGLKAHFYNHLRLG